MTDPSTSTASDHSEEDSGSFSDAEKAAMQERAEELRVQKGGRKKAKNLEAVLEKIEQMPPADRVIAAGLHALVFREAPDLEARTWYGMPSYALDGQILIFLQPAEKFETRYSTVGFNDLAQLDDGTLWPTSFAVTQWTPGVEQEISRLLHRALGR